MAQKQIFSLLLVGCLAALALANPLPEEHPAVPAPTGPATDPLYQNLASKNARLEGKKEKRSAEEAKTGGSPPIAVPKTLEGKKEKLESGDHSADNVTKEFEELVSLLANPFSPNLTTTAPKDKPKREAEEAKPKTEGVKVASTQPIAAKPVAEPKKEKRENDPEAAELVKAQLICDREGESSASTLDDPSTVDEVYDIAEGCQEKLRELKGEAPRVESHSDEPTTTEEKKEKKSVEDDDSDEPDCLDGEAKIKRSVEEETPRLAAKDVPNEKKEKRSAEEKPAVATKPAPKQEEHKEKRSAEEKPAVATKPAPKEEEHKEKRSAEEKPAVATKPAPKEEEHKEKRSAEEKPAVATKPAPKEEELKEKRSAEEKPVVATKPAPKEEHKEKRSAEEKPAVATKPAPKEEEHKEKRSAEEKPAVATKPAPKEEEHKEKRSAEEKPAVATKPAPKEEEHNHKEKRGAEEKPVVATKPAPKEEHKEKRSAEEEKPTVGTKEVKAPQEKRERRGVNEEKVAKDVPVPREETKKVKRSTVEAEATEGASIKDQPKQSGPYSVPPAQAGSKKDKRYVDQVRAEKQTVPALKSQEPGELEKKVERRSAETTSVIKGAAFEDKPWEVKPYVTAPPAKQASKE